MIGKIRNMIKTHRALVAYMFFGILTTIVDYLVYLPCYNWLKLSATVSNMLAWAASVSFAFLTNKPFVFKSHDWSAKTVWPELARFVGTRFTTGAIETLLLLLTADVFGWDGNVMKLAVSLLVVAFNYIGSKLLVFRDK